MSRCFLLLPLLACAPPPVTCPTDAPVAVLSGQAVRAFAVTTSSVLYVTTDGRALRRVGLDGGGDAAVYEPAASRTLFDVTILSDDVYVIEREMTTTRLRRMTLAGANNVEIALSHPYSRFIATEQSLFLKAQTRIGRFSPTAGETETLVDGIAIDKPQVTSDGVYFLSERKLMRAARSGGSTPAAVSTLTCASFFVTDDGILCDAKRFTLDGGGEREWIKGDVATLAGDEAIISDADRVLGVRLTTSATRALSCGHPVAVAEGTTRPMLVTAGAAIYWASDDGVFVQAVN